MTVTAAQQVACEQSWRDRLYSARCLLAAFTELGTPETMIDVGCGKGHLVMTARALGIDAVGVDAVPDVEWPFSFSPAVVETDLAVAYREWPGSHREPVESFVPAGLVLCWEVAEHLPATAADTLCDTLAAFTGKWLLFTAATPGQGGSGHLHERPNSYWRFKLEARGLDFSPEYTERLRAEWSRVAGSAPWYAANLLVHYRPEGFA